MSNKPNVLSNEKLLNYVPKRNLLKDKVILVTGAGAGVGKVISLAYAHHGATVILLSKTLQKLEVLYDDIVARDYPKPAIYPMCLEGSGEEEYHDLAHNIKSQLGRLDGVVLNAGWLASFTPFKQYDLKLWSKMVTVNMHANFLIIRACLPLLEQSSDPSIIFSSHTANKAYYGGFGVAKAGSDAMCDIVADEYDSDDHFMRVNRIDTGPIRTKMRTDHFPGEDPSTLACPDAIIGPYLYFMGSEAEKITKQNIVLGRLAADAYWPGEKISECLAKM